MIFVCCGSGLITPNAAAGSLGVNSRIVGAASGLGSFIQMIGAAGCTAALSLGRSGSPLTLAIVIAFAGLLCVTAFGSLLQPERLASEGRCESLPASPRCRRPRDNLGYSANILPAPAGWNPQDVIAAHFPEMAELGRAAEPEIRALEARLDRDEAAGRDTSLLRQAMGEIHWRLQYTGDAVAAAAALDRLRALAALAEPPSGLLPDEDGSFGAGTEVWFLKLDASVDRMLADDFTGSGRAPPLSRPRQRSGPSGGLSRQPRRLAPRRGRRRSPQGAELRDRRPRPADPAPPTAGLSMAPGARYRDPALCRALAGSDDRLLWRGLRDRRTAMAHRRSQPDLSHGPLSRRPDRPLAAADRHAAKDPRRPLPQWLARRRGHHQPQQL